MPGISAVGEHRRQPVREIGTLFDSELWWRNQYLEIENHGYRLRPRYHPDWVPSWKKSGRDFFTTEDGQPTLVSVLHLISPMFTLFSVADCNGRNALAG